MRIGSLCSGYGGLDMAVEATFGADTAWFCEYDADPSSILAHHWPHIPNHGDVKATHWTTVEPVDILTAGYPCQPFSHAGKRKGADDPRHLWPDVARCVGVLRPRLVVLENVRGHLSLGLADVLADLSGLGYDARWGVVRAADAGAPHGRARIFVLATDTHGTGSQGSQPATRRNLSDGGAHAYPAGVGWGEGWPESAGRLGRPAAVVGGASAADAARARRERLQGGAGQDGRPQPAGSDRPAPDAASPAHPYSDGCARLAGLPTGRDAVHGDSGSDADRRSPGVEWGAYGPAIDRWERVLGRRAPRPTEPGRSGERLSPRFVEWMQGLPEGHVTDVPGLSRNAQLKALGNGVVPQQAALALRLLLAQERAA